MKRIRLRFIEREYVFNRIKESTEFLTDTAINKLLDEHRWQDLTFIFTEQTPGLVHTIIVDNDTGCDVAKIDLNLYAREFYSKQINKLTYQNVIQNIKNKLYKKDVV